MTRNIERSNIQISSQINIFIKEKSGDTRNIGIGMSEGLKTSKSAIYQILNLNTGKYYIGQTRDIDKRWNKHLNSLRKGTHKNPKLQEDFNIFGENCFQLFVVSYCRPTELSFYENILIKNLTPYYNIKSAPQKKWADLTDEEFDSMDESELMESLFEATKKDSCPVKKEK